MRIITCLLILTALSPSFASEPDWNGGGELHITHSINSNQAINLDPPLTLNIDPGHTVSLHGSVSAPEFGPSRLIKKGAGRLELLGDNSHFDSSTSLREGTLHLGGRYALGNDWTSHLYAHRGTALSYADGAFVASTLTLQDEMSDTPGVGIDPTGIQWWVDDGVATHIGRIHGTVPLIKRGKGTLRLRSAPDLPSSQLTIADGGVDLLYPFPGHIIIGKEAFLTGSGTIGRLTINSGATLVPTGQFNISRALTFHPDSFLQIRTWADGTHDSLTVTNNSAKLDGHVLVLPQGSAEAWQHGNDYVIVHAEGGLGTSRFASVESAVPYLEPSLSYDAHRVTLTLAPPTQHQAPERQRRLTTQNAGWAATVRNRLTDDSRFLRDATYRHATHHESLWSHAFYSSDKQDGTHDLRRLQRRISGLLLGGSADLSSRVRLGLFAGGSHSRLSGRHNDTDLLSIQTGLTTGLLNPSSQSDAVHAGLYAVVDAGGHTTLTAGMAHSWHRIRDQRPVQTTVLSDTLNSRYRARTFQVFSRVSKPLWSSTTNDASITPFADIAWVQTRRNGYTEQGGPLALNVTAQRQSVMLTTLGLQASYRLRSSGTDAQLTGTLGWRRAYGDTTMPGQHYFRDDITATIFKSDGVPLHRDTWQLRLGAQANLGKHALLSLDYAGQLNRRGSDHGIQAGLRFSW